MMSKSQFITEEQRGNLRKAYDIINSVYKDLNYEHEEYFILFTTIDALKSAIECEKRLSQ